jgi:hypothetical protein
MSILLLAGCSSTEDMHPIVDAGDTGTDTVADTIAVDTSHDVDIDTTPPEGDPETCYEAEWRQTYVGCDFWPTVTPNYVGKHFDYAVVVSNAGEVAADITIERDGSLVQTGEVPAYEARTFYLPWVDELKHWTGMCDSNPSTSRPNFASRRMPGTAYHLESSVPVTVYQFNPIEYGPSGGPPGKDWSACDCMFGCHSYTNDASLLIPSTAMTGNYRVTAPAGQNTDDVTQPGYLSITGIEDSTAVRIKVGPGGRVVGGDDIPDAIGGDVLDLIVHRGEVLRIVGTPTTDLSGSLINALGPIQVISGAPCHYMPDEYGACDHLEETVFPVETLGSRYFVTVPTNPRGEPVGHVVKIYGNVDDTTLEYRGSTPDGAPTLIHAGEVHDLGIVEADFEVEGDHEFAVTSFQLGSSLADPGHLTDYRGDPAQSNVYAVEQYRKRYVFLAPNDYDFSFADVVLPEGTVIRLDGVPVSGSTTPIASGYGVMRLPLGPGRAGGHILEADAPVGLQVMGYGFATSYQYPGGLNLTRISEPPLI